jgi:hypothetical protein
MASWHQVVFRNTPMPHVVKRRTGVPEVIGPTEFCQTSLPKLCMPVASLKLIGLSRLCFGRKEVL